MLTDNFHPDNLDYVLILVGKLLKKLLKVENFLIKILTIDFFKLIYSMTKSEKFVLSQVCFKIIFRIVESPKCNREIVNKFFDENCEAISGILTDAINFKGGIIKTENLNNDDYYFMKRETLILIVKILNNPLYEKFMIHFTNRSDNLKTIMKQLNKKSKKIVSHAVEVLYFFFLDIELKEKGIKMILHNNKDNFYKFFEKNEELFNQTSEMMEQKSFLLYELERLENYLD